MRRTLPLPFELRYKMLILWFMRNSMADENFLQTVLHSMWLHSKDGVVVVDSDGKIALVSPSVLEMLNFSEDDLLGQAVEILVPEDRWQAHRRHREAYTESPFARNMGKQALLMAMTSDGRQVPADISLSPVQYEGDQYTVAVIRDASDRHDYEKALREASFRDGLTGLYNRAFLDEELQRLEAGRRRPIAILVADLDGLKTVNDSEGHEAGDNLIRRTADALHGALRVEDIVARSGGDEFVAILPGASEDDAAVVIERVRAACNTPESGAPIDISLGIAVGHPGELLRDILREADAAMYREKRRREEN